MADAYIREYTDLPFKERRQLFFKRQYKNDRPDWDDSLVLLTDLVERSIPDGAQVLDVGCGNGNYILQTLTQKQFATTGLDLDASATRNNCWLDRIVFGNLEHLPFADATFDLVLSLWVLEHLEHPETALHEIQRVLKPGGVFAFATPNKKSVLIGSRRLLPDRWAGKLVRHLYDRQEKDAFPVYYHANDLQTLRDLAHDSGFQIEFLKPNRDPSYTSFNDPTYWLSARIASWPIFKPHLVGWWRKPNLV